MQNKSLFLLTVLVSMSLLLALTGPAAVSAQEEPPPSPVPLRSSPSHPPVYNPSLNPGIAAERAELIDRAKSAVAQPQPDAQGLLTLGQPGLSFRYVQTFGVTEEPYFSDTTHLNRPVGLFMDGSNNLYVTEDSGNRVLKYNPAGNNLLVLGQAGLCLTDNYLFCTPKDVALDGNGNLWVADGNRVVEYNPSGTFIQQMPVSEPWVPGDDNTHFNFTNGIAFDGLGRMYVSDSNNHRVQVYTFNAGAPVYHSTIGVTGLSGGDNNHLNFPYHLVTDSSNRVYIVDRDNNRVQRCTRSTSWVCTPFASGLNGPHGISIDGSNNIYIADTWNGRIRKCTSGGICSDLVTNTYHFYDLEVDSGGNVYGAATYDGVVVKYNSSGTGLGFFVGTELVPYLTDNSHYYQPRIAIDGQNNIIIIEELGQRLTKLAPNGNFQWSVGVPGLDAPDNDHFNYPHGVAADQNGNIYVADSNRVQIFNGAGTYLNTIGGTWGSGNYEFQWASGIAVDRNNGNIYVADGPNQRVQVYNSNHVYLATLGVNGVPGSDNAHFNYPIGVEVDAAGNIYVADINNCRVQKFNSGRIYLKTFGTTGSCTDSFADVSAEDVTVDANGRVYIAGWDNRVQVFDSNGAYLTTIGGVWGNLSSQFRGASGVAVDSQGNVYVSDFTNARIQKFAPGVPGWQQVNINGFGNSRSPSALSMAVFNNQLYAGASTWDGSGASIWRTSNGSSWSRVMTSGFGQAGTNPAVIGMIPFKGNLYAGTGWGGAPGQLWRSSNGTTWNQITGNGIGTTTNPISTFAIYGDTLYAGTCGEGGAAGAQIWRSTTGNSGTWASVVTGGRNTPDNSCVTGLAVFSGALYAAVENTVSGAQIWRSATGSSGSWTQVNTSGFGSPGNDLVGGFAVYAGQLYIGTHNGTTGAQLWRSSNGTTWNPVMTNGFGDVNNDKLESLFVFDGALYAGLNNFMTGLEVWRSSNGSTWNQANLDGFGSSNNNSSLWSNETVAFKGALYLGISSPNGLGIWRSVPMTISGNTGVAGATISYSEAVTQTAISMANGGYTFGVPYTWSGTVTPTHACFTFSPSSRNYPNVTANQTSQNYTPTIVPGCADINISVGGVNQGRFGVPSPGSTRASFPGLNHGPVKIQSTNAVPAIGAERLIYKVNNVATSFTEMMALPASQLDNTYWLPWYNNVDLDTQLRFANVSGSPATVTITIGGQVMGSPIQLAAGASTRVSFAGVNNGPVKIQSNVNIVAAERLIYKVNGVNTSFSEMMALPASQLDNTYWLPWYNNADLDTQLRIGNVSGSTATVHIFIGPNEVTPVSGITLLAGGSTRLSYAGVNNGPVKIVSDQNIVAAERLIYKVNGVNTSFTEMMALPNSQLDNTYWLPWYNNADLDTQLRFANVHASQTAQVHVYVGGVEMPNSPFTLLPGASTRQTFAGINNGPVQIVSNVPIVAAERLIYKVNGVNTSFSEMMALPNGQLDTIYWLPWYNNADLDTQLRFGVP